MRRKTTFPRGGRRLAKYHLTLGSFLCSVLTFESYHRKPTTSKKGILYIISLQKRIHIARLSFYMVFIFTPSCFPGKRYIVYRVSPDSIHSAGILEQSMGARNRVGIGLSYRTGPPELEFFFIFLFFFLL
jgi:hypothetical protein